jgi:hypothetical protein
MAAAAAVVPVLALSGCTFGGHGSSESSSASLAAAAAKKPVKKLKLSLPYTGTVTGLPGGTFTPSDDGNSVTIQDRPYNGTLAGALPKKVRVQKKPKSKKTFKLKQMAGTYHTSVDGTARNDNTGQYTGLQVVRFTRKPLGVACIQFNSTTNDTNLTEAGTFALIGGTKAAKRMRFAGTFTQQGQASSGNTSPVSGTLTGKVRFGKKPRGLNAECRALLPLVP